MKIAFLGNMNNMAYQVAKCMRGRGLDVTLYVDAPHSYRLDRPESWDGELEAGYPHWLVDLKHVRAVRGFEFLAPRIFLAPIIRLLRKHDVVFLNGNWITLGQYLTPNAIVVNMFAGADLDHCAPEAVDELVRAKGGKYPGFLLREYYRRLWGNQTKGVRRAQIVNYYLPGVNPRGDELLESIKKGQQYQRLPLRGFDCTRFPYDEVDIRKDVFDILSITRFFFMRERNDNKRNDIMIDGIGKFVKAHGITKNLRITFFEKGEDVGVAKAMCDERGLTQFVSWMPQVRIEELLPFFRRADVVFDQLGTQWVGAGLFSMLVGRPLIANSRSDLYEKYVGEAPPICQATTSDEVSEWLSLLYRDRSEVLRKGRASADYVRNHYDMDKTVDFYLQEIGKLKAQNAL